MDKKIIIGLIAALALVIMLLTQPRLFKKSETSNPDLTNFSSEMTGRIIEVKGDSIVVAGVVKSLDPSGIRQEDKTVEFRITPQTVLRNNAIVITLEQVKSGKTFTPKTETRPGNTSQLTVDMRITKILSQENLFDSDRAIAIEINYATYDTPTL